MLSPPHSPRAQSTVLKEQYRALLDASILVRPYPSYFGPGQSFAPFEEVEKDEAEAPPRQMLALRQSFKKRLQIKDRDGQPEKAVAATEPAPAAQDIGEPDAAQEGDSAAVAKEANSAAATEERDSASDRWIRLETWLRNAASSQEWDIRDRQAYRRWNGVLRLLIRGYLAVQDERHERGLWCDSLEAKDLLVSGTLDLTLPRNEIMASESLRFDLLGYWRRAELHETGYARGRKDYDLNILVEKVADEHFPQYADWY